MIQVDGSQHVHKGMFGVSLEDQQQIDARCNSNALTSGRALLRLHCCDLDHWEYQVKLCAQRAQRGECFVQHSTKFNG